MAMNGTLSAAKPAARQTATEKALRAMRGSVEAMTGELQKALPENTMTAERFKRIVLSALSKTPKLAECSATSFMAAMMSAAQLGLEPNTPLGHAFLVPYRNHGVMECQFQIGYKGLLDLAYRSGEVVLVQAHEVCENDQFEYSLGLNPDLRHVPATGDRGAPTHFYAVWKGKNGGFGFEVMTREEVDAHARRFSKAYEDGPWKTNFAEMAKKTVLKKALKYAPMKTEFSSALALDGTVQHRVAADVWDAEPEHVDPEDDVVAEVRANEMTVQEEPYGAQE